MAVSFRGSCSRVRRSLASTAKIKTPIMSTAGPATAIIL
jgi:hypothetical protein